jgi:hypothetical protein
MMQERLEEGLRTKIPKENKGFQMLLKMGFKEDQKKLGKEGGLENPLAPELKKNMHGIGKEEAVKERGRMQTKYS